MLYRLLCSAYLIFGMSLSIANHSANAPWIIFLTSCIYVLTLIYFLYGSALSWYSVRYKAYYCRSNTMTGGIRGPKERHPNKQVLDLSTHGESKSPRRFFFVFVFLFLHIAKWLTRRERSKWQPWNSITQIKSVIIIVLVKVNTKLNKRTLEFLSFLCK